MNEKYGTIEILKKKGMGEMKGYFAAATSGKSEFVEKKSRFITHVATVESAAAAESFVAEIKKQYPDARHHCWAYRVHDPFGERYSDDGEPQGTAGPPMLNVLQKEEVEDICVVVTRYFGGVLLGAAGLTRAYSRGCADGVRVAGKSYKCPAIELTIEAPYERWNAVERQLEQVTHLILDKQFHTGVTLQLAMPVEQADDFSNRLVELSGGKIAVQKGSERLICFKF